MFLVFARLGAALMVLPGIGEHYVLPRLRLLLALALSLLLAPALAARLPALPEEPLRLAALLGPEILTGLVLGFAARLAMAAIHVGGSLIATQSGLAAAGMFDPNEAATGTIPGTFLTVAALAILFAADFHHLLLRAVAASYAVLPVAAPLDLAAASELLVGLSAAAVTVGTIISGRNHPRRRIDSLNCSGLTGFCRKRLQPSSWQRSISRLSSAVVSMITGIFFSEGSAFSRRSISTPSIFGIRRSSRNTNDRGARGGNSARKSKNSCPLRKGTIELITPAPSRLS